MADAEMARASQMLLSLTYVLRLAYAGKFNPENAADGLKTLLAKAGGAPDFPTLEQQVLELRRFVRADLLRLFGEAATEAGLSPV